MSEMAGRVEQAMRHWDDVWGTKDDTAYWAKLARCAILAMRQPTEDMKNAGLRAALHDFHAAPDQAPLSAVRDRLSVVAYTAMIDEALKLPASPQ